MPARPFFWQSPSAVTLAVLALMAFAALRYLDQAFGQAGLWLFAGLTLTVGFFHGALDIVLLQREFTNARRLAGALALYLAVVVLLATLCLHNNLLMVLALLLMSVWHFGEPYGRWGPSKRTQDLRVQRLIAGGAPVMLPLLLSGPALHDILPMAVGADAAWAWMIWQTLAWLWVGLCALGIAVLRQQVLSKTLWAEVALVFASNLLLSPLMAFSIYFGVLHAASHIFRVTTGYRHRKPVERTDKKYRPFTEPSVTAIVVTSLATVLLLFTLGWYLKNMSIAVGDYAGLLNGLLVALTAVTLPHLVLVSRNADWLTVRHAADTK